MGTYDTHSGHARHDSRFDESEDDTICAHCQSKLPESDPDFPDRPEFNGFCDHACWVRDIVEKLAKFPDDDVNGSTRRELNAAIEILIVAYNRWRMSP